ncbi:MAG: caspase family protein [Bacteroidales bacterium]|nr:caspase family protein [Bacteroidales bacterium]
MKKIKYFLLLIFLQSLSVVFVHGQFKARISVEILETNYNSGKLTVKYKIYNARPKDKVRVWINVFNSKSDSIKAVSWTGAVNRFIDNPNEDKIAVWDVYKDKAKLIDTLQIKVSASVQNGFYLDNPFILSTVFPGWGDYQIKPRKPYWIYGVLGYGFLGVSFYMNNSSYNNYNSYLGAETIALKDDYYSKSVTNNTLSYVFLGAAGVVWLVDYIGLIKRTKQIKKKWERHYPIKETPDVPNFKVTSSLSAKLFVNTYLTNLQLVENSIFYEDLDQNHCLDAFEKGYINLKLKNYGPAPAMNFYAYIACDNENVKLPEKVKINTIPVNGVENVKIHVKALKNIQTGSCEFTVNIIAKYNNPVPEIKFSVKTCSFKYPDKLNRNQLLADIDRNIPVIRKTNPAKYALIIGNEGYANEKTGLSKNFNVPYARNDAISFKEYAIKVLGVPESNVVLLLDATKNEMLENIINISRQVRKEKDNAQAELLFYYAGQGLANLQTKAPYMMPVDINPEDIEKAISIEFLYKKIWESRSSKNIVVIDASFNNRARKIGLRGPDAPIIFPRKEVLSGNTIVFLAVSDGHTSNIYKEKHHGLFTYYFLKELKKSKGNIGLKSFSDLVIIDVSDKSKELGFHQMPMILESIAIKNMWQDWRIK